MRIALFLLALVAPCAAAPARPDVVLVSIDMLRADAVGPGAPALESFARGAVAYDRAYTHATYTVPAHMTLLTGQDPFAHGSLGNAGVFPKPDAPLLSERFRAAGYETAAFTAGWVDAARFRAGFGRFRNRGHHDADPDAGFREAAAWLARPRKDERPRFVFVHSYHVHNFLRRSDGSRDDDPLAAAFEADPALSPRLRAAYQEAVVRVDAALARFLAAVPAGAGVAVTSDHGQNFFEPHGEAPREYGHGAPYEAALRVPLLLRPPGGGAGRRVVRRVGLDRLAGTLAGFGGFAASGEHALPAEDDAPRGDDRVYFIGRSGPGLVYGVIDGDEKALLPGDGALLPEMTMRLKVDPDERAPYVRDGGPEAARLEALLRERLAETGADRRRPAPRSDERVRAALRATGYEH